LHLINETTYKSSIIYYYDNKQALMIYEVAFAFFQEFIPKRVQPEVKGSMNLFA